MVVNIRGTSGTGKTTLVRKLMKIVEEERGIKWMPHYTTGRKRPLYYTHVDGHRMFAVLGSYENPTGGCDTISGYDFLFGLVEELVNDGYTVIMEGLLISGDSRRVIQAHCHKGLNFRVLYIDLPLEQCLASINERRRCKNPDAPDVNPETTTSKWRSCFRVSDKLKAAGVPVFWGNREETLTEARRLLNV